ncbi:hypothetical protein BFF78_03225 [Streptomyces fodineus]|uniref:NlpC/P60 domain-containing protein n=1 Tax=Streptomyces fodineus TaxID=1904616 RepID=A0A1D7Y3P2_9ACTN|nr:C40 family peptidase [Streptomyces fodineus]AOR30202.1 hypothetical protein BFF78_03225 [Streptomyces fodineus]
MAPESRDEVRQRIESLYDQAENATGNYNATRAMASVTRSRGVPLAKRPGRRPDPALDEVARQWFDVARAKLGPTVPAVLPADRLPDRPASPGRSRDRMGRGLPGAARDALGPGPSTRRPEALERAVDRVVAELTAGRATDPESLALAARESGRAALPGPRRPELPGGGGELSLPGGGGVPGVSGAELALPGPAGLVGSESGGIPAGLTPVEPAGLVPVEPAGLVPVEPTGLVPVEPTGFTPLEPSTLAPPEPTSPGIVETAVLPVAMGAPVQEPTTSLGSTMPGRPSPAASKASNQRKLAAASDVLSRYTAQLVGLATAVQPMPVTTPPPETVTAAPPTPVMPPMAAPPAGVTTAPTSPVTTAVAPMPPTTVADLPPAPVAPPQPSPVQPAPDPGTGQWQQPQPMAPGAVATPAPAVEPWSATMPATTPVTDTGSLTFASESPQATRAAKAIAFARAQIGKPCVWGATGPDSYDCSSLTQAAWKAAGVALPRAAHQQALAGAPVTLAGIEPGDLVLFFDDDRHVGLHVGGGMMVHAPGPGSSIREESIYGAGESAIHRIVRPV